MLELLVMLSSIVIRKNKNNILEKKNHQTILISLRYYKLDNYQNVLFAFWYLNKFC